MYSLLYLSGGTGSRTGSDVPKQYLELGGVPTALHVLRRIDSIAEIGEVIIVCAEGYQDFFKYNIKKYNLKKQFSFANSGKLRQDSVFNGLEKCNFDKVLLHESARPFVRAEQFKTLINSEEQNLTYTYPIPFTVLSADKYIDGILERDKLCNIQLPQKFNKNALYAAHQKAQAEKKIFSDDSSLLYFYSNAKILTLPGSNLNLKITDQIDLRLAEIIYGEYFNDM